MKIKLATVMVGIFLAGCAPRDLLLPKLGQDVPALRQFPADFEPPVSNETGKPVVGFGGGGGGVTRTPIIFVHGNTVSARFWLTTREYFKAAGYTDDELWAVGYGWDSVRYFDSNDLSAPTLERFVTAVQDYLQRKGGHPVPQVNIVAHSLGVTLVRQWMKQENAWHRVRNFVGVAGGNHGVWTARLDSRSQNRVVSYELAIDSLWLEQLNRGGEAPGATRYLMIYDGTGWADVLFPPAQKDSSALDGATNLALNVERGTHYDHLELPVVKPSVDAMLDFFKQSGDAPAAATAPTLKLNADLTLTAQPTGAQVACTEAAETPRATHAVQQFQLEAGRLNTCFAFDPATGLASGMQHYRPSAMPMAANLISLTASKPSGAYENPILVTLTASDPAAHIVYSTGGGVPESGSPLYSAPIYVPGPLRLVARAIAADGRRSEPLALDYDISLEKIEAAHSLQRQFDTTVPEQYSGLRKDGR